MIYSNLLKRISVASLLLLAATLSLISIFCIDAVADDKGLLIAREGDRRDSGYGDYSAIMVMTLRSADGKEALRKMRLLDLEVNNDGDKTLLVFDAPKDVEGTALLTWSHKTKDDDVWLYLPSLSRVKRISGNNKSGAFMGSEFAFEDIGSPEVEKFTYQFIEESQFDGQLCTVVDQVPTYANSGYSRQRVWRDKAEYRVLKIDYYNHRNELLKTMRAFDYKRYLDRFWFPGRYEMVNHKSGRSTKLLFQNYKLRNGYTSRDFDQTSIQSAR
ncbi:MAG: outer membrane lipoprotein-sorting protein [Deltaproteobacteria bacterium HGW-Deltaproteobacteria-2]|jgi:outer membrane lipoprotein-sorting protein|nr:MAG: outer membrane lipoprotein-sorting protein [Deltaproteobacteria bacterium HGW-Deltaproteobacteria-2]